MVLVSMPCVPGRVPAPLAVVTATAVSAALTAAATAVLTDAAAAALIAGYAAAAGAAGAVQLATAEPLLQALKNTMHQLTLLLPCRFIDHLQAGIDMAVALQQPLIVDCLCTITVCCQAGFAAQQLHNKLCYVVACH